MTYDTSIMYLKRAVNSAICIDVTNVVYSSTLYETKNSNNFVKTECFDFFLDFFALNVPFLTALFGFGHRLYILDVRLYVFDVHFNDLEGNFYKFECFYR